VTSVRASVRYLNAEWRDREERPRIGSRESRRENTSFHEVEIHDARPENAGGELSLDRTGFVLVSHRSEVHDFRDGELVEEVFYREWDEKLRALTGANDVLFLQNQIRTESPCDFNDAYARYVHCDFSDRRLHIRHQDPPTVEPAEFDYVWYNIWQPIEREVQQNPLALIDASSIPRRDIVEYVYTAAGTDAISTMPVFGEGHRFCYFPRMQPDEAIVFKQFDGRGGHAFACPHTSFDDPTAPVDAVGRRSIEVRALAVFSKP
jgi:hypothetical protein